MVRTATGLSGVSALRPSAMTAIAAPSAAAAVSRRHCACSLRAREESAPALAARTCGLSEIELSGKSGLVGWAKWEREESAPALAARTCGTA